MTRLLIMVPICKGPIQEAIIHLFTTFRRGVSRVITQEEMRIETRAGEDLQMSRHKAEGLMNNMVSSKGVIAGEHLNTRMILEGHHRETNHVIHA